MRRGRRRVWLIRHASDSPLNSDLRKSDTLEHFYATELPASQIILGVECGGFQNVAAPSRWAKSTARPIIEARRISPQRRIHGIIIKVSLCNQVRVMSFARIPP